MTENEQKTTGFEAPKHTQTPNELFDNLMRNMTDPELRVVLCAVRQTFGWHKDRDAISLTQFQKMTGLSRQGVIDGIERATTRGLLRHVGTGIRNTGIYELCIKSTGLPDGLVNAVDQSTGQTRTSQRGRPELVNAVDTQKKERKERKKIAPATQDAPLLAKAVTRKERNPLFDAVAVHIYGAKLDDTGALKSIAGRIGKIVAFLNTRVDPYNCADCLPRFVTWYQQQYPDTDLPRDDGKFASHWIKFEVQTIKAIPITRPPLDLARMRPTVTSGVINPIKRSNGHG